MESKKYKILLIDDDKFLAAMYATKLRERGVEVEIFSDTTGDIVQRVLAIKPDLISLDIIIPDKDGLEVARLLKANKRTASIPFVFLTNLEQKEDIELGKKVGALAYFIHSKDKPADIVKALLHFGSTVTP